MRKASYDLNSQNVVGKPSPPLAFYPNATVLRVLTVSLPLPVCSFWFRLVGSQFRSSRFMSARDQRLPALFFFLQFLPALEPSISLLDIPCCPQIQPLKHKFYIVFGSKQTNKQTNTTLPWLFLVFGMRTRFLWLEILT